MQVYTFPPTIFARINYVEVLDHPWVSCWALDGNLAGEDAANKCHSKDSTIFLEKMLHGTVINNNGQVQMLKSTIVAFRICVESYGGENGLVTN